MSSVLECSICRSAFSHHIKRPMVGKCGHTVCLTCSLRLRLRRCRYCCYELAFISPSTNYSLLELLDEPRQPVQNAFTSEEPSSYNACPEETTSLTNSNNTDDFEESGEQGICYYCVMITLIPFELILVMLMLIFLLFAAPICFLASCCSKFQVDYLDDFEDIPFCECTCSHRRMTRNTEANDELRIGL